MSLTPKALAVLHVLVTRPGQVVMKDEFFQSVWNETVVSDDALAACIQELRRALRDDARKPRYIETAHRRGYRFIGKVVSDQSSVVSQTEEVVSSQEEKGGNGLESRVQNLESNGQSLASRVQSLESENQPSSLSPIQTLEGQPPIPTLPIRRLGSRSSLFLLGLLLIGGSFVVHHLSLPIPSTQGLPLPDKPSIAVMPFTNMSGDPEQEYFSDGLTDDLITVLSRLSQLFVIARHSVFTYKGKAVKVQDVSKELGVRYILEGSVRKTDKQVRINAQLVDATTGYHLWAQRYDRPLQDIFTLQDEIVQKIVTTLKLQLSLQEQGILVHKTTDNLEAYDYFLRGMESYYRFTKEATIQARQMFAKALALDPQYAAAYATLGATYTLEWNWQWSTDPHTLERAGELAQKAIALDASARSAHLVLSYVYVHKQQPDQAIAESEQAIALDPNAAISYVQLAEILNTVGRPEEAVRLVEQAMRLNPRYPAWYLLALGHAYRQTGRYAEAITAWKQALGRNPNMVGAHMGVAFASCLQWGFQFIDDPQTLAQALAAAQRAVTLNDSAASPHLALSSVYLWQKQYEKAVAEGERAGAVDPTYWKSGVYASLADRLSRAGRAEEALKVAEQALRLGLPPFTPTDLHFYHLGSASYLIGRYEEARVLLQQLLGHYPKHLGGHLTLAAVYSELGKEAEARAEAAEVLRLNPKFSLEVHKQRAPIKDPKVLERMIVALRKAGLK